MMLNLRVLGTLFLMITMSFLDIEKVKGDELTDNLWLSQSPNQLAGRWVDCSAGFLSIYDLTNTGGITIYSAFVDDNCQPKIAPTRTGSGGYKINNNKVLVIQSINGRSYQYICDFKGKTMVCKSQTSGNVYTWKKI